MLQVKENFNYKHAKASWMSAAEAFKLVGYLSEIGAAEGSIDSLMRAGKYNKFFEDAAAPPQGQSDFRSCVPLIYTLINGIEMFIKACEYAAYPERVPAAPSKLPALIAAFDRAPYPKDASILALVHTYTGEGAPDLLKRFLARSGLTVADLLMIRRHISNHGFFTAIERYQPLLFDSEEGKRFFAMVLADVTPVIPLTTAFAAAIDDDGNPGRPVKMLLVT